MTACFVRLKGANHFPFSRTQHHAMVIKNSHKLPLLLCNQNNLIAPHHYRAAFKLSGFSLDHMLE